jgi:RimJ/RimL family protein N-acetyltransferase
VKRLELSVMTHNERGIALYKKMGFEIEGTKRASIYVNGNYVDEYLMSKIIHK